MATIKQGARIELLSVGSVREAYVFGKYWAKELAYGATVDGINLKRINKGWKVVIKYQPKETAQ